MDESEVRSSTMGTSSGRDAATLGPESMDAAHCDWLWRSGIIPRLKYGQAEVVLPVFLRVGAMEHRGSASDPGYGSTGSISVKSHLYNFLADCDSSVAPHALLQSPTPSW